MATCHCKRSEAISRECYRRCTTQTTFYVGACLNKWLRLDSNLYIDGIEPDDRRSGTEGCAEQADTLVPQIESIAFPDLPVLSGRGETLAIVTLTAVWFHLDQDQRQCGMPRVTALVKPEGLMMLSLRHGPVPPGGACPR